MATLNLTLKKTAHFCEIVDEIGSLSLYILLLNTKSVVRSVKTWIERDKNGGILNVFVVICSCAEVFLFYQGALHG